MSLVDLQNDDHSWTIFRYLVKTFILIQIEEMSKKITECSQWTSELMDIFSEINKYDITEDLSRKRKREIY